MQYGLDEITIQKIQDVFEAFWQVDRAILYGSRAKGNFKPGSDIDITLKGAALSLTVMNRVALKLDDLLLPYTFDLSVFAHIKNPDLIDHIDRVGVEFYSRWKEYKFSELLLDESISYGIVQPGTHTEINSVPIIRGNNLKNGKIITDEIMKVSATVEEKFLRTRLIGGELLITVVGSVGECAIVPAALKGWNVARAISVARIKQGFDTEYIKYAFKTDDLKFQMYGNTNDTVQPTLNLSSLKELIFTLPSFKEQNKITSILLSLDNKIDLLHRQNKTLEQLAETLFRQWFVENAAGDFESKTLGQFIETTMGGEWGKETASEDYQLEVQCIRGTDIADLETGIPERTPIRFIKQKKFESIEIKGGDLILEISGGTDDQSTGRTAYINKDVKTLFKYPLIFSNFCRLIRPKRKEYSFFLYSYLHHLYKQGDLFNLENGSSGIKNLNYKALLFDLEYKLPDENNVIKYHNDVEQYFYKINKNKLQIQSLTKMRDTLLPKLMSGEVRVML